MSIIAGRRTYYDLICKGLSQYTYSKLYEKKDNPNMWKGLIEMLFIVNKAGDEYTAKLKCLADSIKICLKDAPTDSETIRSITIEALNDTEISNPINIEVVQYT